MSVFDTIQNAHADMTRGGSESIEDFAKRLYYRQMEIYSAHAGRDLDTPFELIGPQARKSWFDMAEAKS